MPERCPGVPSELLRPRNTWPDPVAYDQRALHPAGLFRANFKSYASQVPESVRQAGPRG